MSTQKTSNHIFVSVGTRYAMDRLLESVERVARKHSELIVSAQTGYSVFESTHLKTTQWIDAPEFKQAVRECDVLVSHAGMGNVLLAAEYNKPIVIMPRREELGEHVNNHQIGTAAGLAGRPLVTVVNDSDELENAIIAVLENRKNSVTQQNANECSKHKLISGLKSFIDNV